MEKSRQNHRKINHHTYFHGVPLRVLHLEHPWVLLVIVFRAAAAIYIFINPVWGFIWTCLFDFLDWQILKRGMHYTAGMYQQLDKPLDWIGYAVEYVVGFSLGFGVLLTMLLIHRFIGQVLYAKTNRRIWFIVFPNLFEIAFLWYIVLPYAGVVIDAHKEWLWYLIGIKIIQEMIVHIITPKYYIWNINRGVLRYHLPTR
jgi:hypothetical protein